MASTTAVHSYLVLPDYAVILRHVESGVHVSLWYRARFIKGEHAVPVLATLEQTIYKQVNLLSILWVWLHDITDYEMKVWYSATVFTALLVFVVAWPQSQLNNEFLDRVLENVMESRMLTHVRLHGITYTVHLKLLYNQFTIINN